LVTQNTKFESSFYENKIHTMKFFYKYELPKTKAHMETLMNTELLTIVSKEKELFI
jgi:butyryl-CoA dehydrogenase